MVRRWVGGDLRCAQHFADACCARMLCMHDSMLHCILHVGILLVHICGSCIWHVGMLYMHVACWHAVHACWHIVHVCDLWFFLASARVAASLHWCSMQPGVAFFMKATPGCHRKKNKYNHCILYIYIMFATLVCTNTIISHCPNKGQNKTRTFYNIMKWRW